MTQTKTNQADRRQNEIQCSIIAEESIYAEENVQKEKNTLKEGSCEANKEGGQALKAAITKETKGKASKSLVEQGSRS